MYDLKAIGPAIAIMALSPVKQETLVKAQTIFTNIFEALTGLPVYSP